jgi:TorA maturation chaperone TorD
MLTQVLAILYDLLAHCFRCPGGYFTEPLKARVGDLGIELWQAADDAGPTLPLATFVRELAALDGQGLERLHQEYTRLFGPAPEQAPCPLYERSHRPDVDAKAILASLQRSYRDWPVQVPTAAPDRLDVELAFVAFLYRRMDDPTADPVARSVRQAFLENHLLCWAPGFVASLKEATDHPFYRAAIQILEKVLACEESVRDVTSIFTEQLKTQRPGMTS